MERRSDRVGRSAAAMSPAPAARCYACRCLACEAQRAAQLYGSGLSVALRRARQRLDKALKAAEVREAAELAEVERLEFKQATKRAGCRLEPAPRTLSPRARVCTSSCSCWTNHPPPPPPAGSTAAQQKTPGVQAGGTNAKDPGVQAGAKTKTPGVQAGGSRHATGHTTTKRGHGLRHGPASRSRVWCGYSINYNFKSHHFIIISPRCVRGLRVSALLSGLGFVSATDH